MTEDSKDSWKYEFSGNGLFSPVQETLSLPSDSTFIIQNQLNTTSITVRKEWDGDQDNAYGTRPTTGRDDYNWEVSLLVQYSSDGGTNWTTLTARTPSVAEPGYLCGNTGDPAHLRQKYRCQRRSKPERPARL